MNKNYFVLFAISYLLLAIFPLAASAKEGGLVPCDQCGLCDFFVLISNIFNFVVFKVAPPLGGFMFLVAGILYLVSGGSEERVGQAKKIFINTVIGLTAVFASWLIVSSLIGIIAKDIPEFSKESWWKFKCTTQ